MISFDEFKKIEIRIGTILEAERIEGTDKLMRLEVDLGERKQQLVAGIAHHYGPEQVKGRQIPVLCNLEPRKIRGVESNGMILAVAGDDFLALLHPDKEVRTGSTVS